MLIHRSVIADIQHTNLDPKHLVELGFRSQTSGHVHLSVAERK